MIFTQQLNEKTFTEVEFSSENGDVEKVPGTLENEYTISVIAPGKYLRSRASFRSMTDEVCDKPLISSRDACWGCFTHHVR